MFRPGKAASPEDILKHLDNGGLSKYEMPEFFLQIDEIPLTASGKIRKRDIVEWIADGRARPMAIDRQEKVG
jgi:acyl-CoA synthetase